MFSSRHRPPKDERDAGTLARLIIAGKTEEAKVKARQVLQRQETIAKQRSNHFNSARAMQDE